ncbi:MAG: hypothetical protein ACJA1A_000256 [Saprospiraceae bacterium]|jgi:hypothetical protein|tara:strand:+ start:830 stop:1405 length:576 start_codon:yes stop_codon:yes gene_type:complete
MKNHLLLLFLFLASFLYGQKDIFKDIGTIDNSVSINLDQTHSSTENSINIKNGGTNFNFSFYENVNFDSGLEYVYFEDGRLQNNIRLSIYIGSAQYKSIISSNTSKTEIVSSSSNIFYSQKSPDLKKMELSLSFIPRVNYKINEDGQLFAKPTFRLSPNKLVNDPNAIKLISLGLEYGYGQLFSSFLNKAN